MAGAEDLPPVTGRSGYFSTTLAGHLVTALMEMLCFISRWLASVEALLKPPWMVGHLHRGEVGACRRCFS